MKKLLNLLNEYECYINGYDICTGWQERDGRIVWVTDDPRPQVRSEYYILSKEYGFIKWLVENDKIDKEKIDTRLVKSVESHYDEEGYWVENSYEDYSDIDTLLMLLSILDTPIDLLCNLLK